MSQTKKQNIRQVLFISFGAAALLALVAGFFLWSWQAAGVACVAVLCLALGFWITELLVGVMTGTKRASPVTILLLFLAKLSWWAGIFFLSRSLETRWLKPVALGIGAFLFSLLIAGVSLYGFPKVTDVKDS